MTDRLPPVVQIAREPNLWQRIRRRVGIVLCAVGIHLVRVCHEFEQGKFGAPGRKVAALRCWRCGRYA